MIEVTCFEVSMGKSSGEVCGLSESNASLENQFTFQRIVHHVGIYE